MEHYFSETDLKKNSFLVDSDFSFYAVDIDTLGNEIPVANVKVDECGFWIERKSNFPSCHNGYFCSKCGLESLFDLGGYSVKSPFCPHCGVKMIDF